MTRDMTIQKSEVGLSQLDAEVRAVTGQAVAGLSYDGETVIVHWLDEQAPAALLEQVKAVIAAHRR